MKLSKSSYLTLVILFTAIYFASQTFFKNTGTNIVPSTLGTSITTPSHTETGAIFSSVLKITTVLLPDAVVGKDYVAKIEASGPSKEILLNFSNLPIGLHQGYCGQPDSGHFISCFLSGNIKTPGSYIITAITADSSNQTVSKNFFLKVLPY